MGILLERIIDYAHRSKPYVYGVLGMALAALLLLFFANGFFAEHFAWTPTRGEIVLGIALCVLAALVCVSALLALPMAAIATVALYPFVDYAFLSIFKVTWAAFSALIAAGFLLGKGSGGSEKPQWILEQERQEHERQCRRTPNIRV